MGRLLWIIYRVLQPPKRMKMVWGILGVTGFLLLAGPAIVANAQPPERFRLDLGFGSLFRKDEPGFLGGSFAPRAGLVGPTDVLALFDVTGTVNITERLSFSAGLPFGLVENFGKVREGTSPLGGLFEEGDTEFGIGDVHAEVNYQLLGEGRFSPGVSVGAEGGAPTAKYVGLGTGLWRATGRVSLSKSLHPRLFLFAGGSFSHFFEKKEVDPGPIASYGGGVGIGITRAILLNLQVEEIAGGEFKESSKVVSPFTRDLQAGVGATIFSKGRPRLSAFFSAGGLRNDPVFLLTFRWAVLSF